jgi:hypothetical protein
MNTQSHGHIYITSSRTAPDTTIHQSETAQSKAPYMAARVEGGGGPGTRGGVGRTGYNV